MRYTDIAIIGGGLDRCRHARPRRHFIARDRSGSGMSLDFRVEKLSGGEQLSRFFQTGIAESVLRSATHDGENWIARFGYLPDKTPSRQYGIIYDARIKAIRT